MRRTAQLLQSRHSSPHAIHHGIRPLDTMLRSASLLASQWQTCHSSETHTSSKTPHRSRHMSSSAVLRRPPTPPPKNKDRGPVSKEDTQTDFGKMDIYTNTPPPSTAIDACHDTGFVLNSGLRISGSAVLLVGGEAFRWNPGRRHVNDRENDAAVYNDRGQLDPGEDTWGLLELVWPKPDLMILGTGASIVPLSPRTRSMLNDLGIRVEVQDTRNAAAQFNLLATERGVQQVAAALLPIGWRAR